MEAVGAGRRMAVVVGVALAMLSLVASAQAAFPGSNGKIAYHISGSGIYRINPDGTNPELVKANAYNAVWSADGSKIGYLLNGTEIRITAADGTGSTLVCTCIDTSSWMTWSPDATRFAFHKPATGAHQIFRVNADGTGETQLTSAGDNRFPSWSPDGSKIAFISNRTPAGVWVMNADGTAQASLSASSADDRPSWSPDGSKIAFQRLGGLWTMNADGSNQVQITTGGVSSDRSPAWSPDGQQIAFRGAGLEVVNADGTGRTSLGVSARQPDWQPIPPSYARPKGATPLRASLVPAYAECLTPNRTHGPPLESGSCNPPQQSSAYLTVGSPDANGQPAAARGFALATVVPGNPATQTDEADVTLDLELTDVRLQSDLSAYDGELRAEMELRATDKDNMPFSSSPGTVVDQSLTFDAPCAGGTCSVATSADALVPGWVKEGRRAIWQLGQVRILDGGPDGDVSTNDNTLFAVGGVFVP